MSGSHGQPIWYELMTPDPNGAKSFYDAVVGWNIESRPSGAMDYRMIRRTDGGNAGGVLRLTEDMLANGARPAWLGYFAVEDIDAVVVAAKASGGAVHLPAYEIANVGRIAMLSDPTGAIIYVIQPATAGSNDVFSTDQAQHVRWHELASTNPDLAIAFYTQLFGWRQEGAMEMGEFGQYRFLYAGEHMMGAVMPLLPGKPESSWTYYIGIDDIDRGAEALKASGGQLIQDPIEIPGGEYSLLATDPQGAAFALVGPRNNRREPS